VRDRNGKLFSSGNGEDAGSNPALTQKKQKSKRERMESIDPEKDVWRKQWNEGKERQRWILQNGYGSRRQKLIQKMEQQHGTQPAMRGWICLRQLDPCAERIRKELSFCLRKHIRQTRCSH